MIEDSVKRILDAISGMQPQDRPAVVAIAGPPGSGKSTLANAIASQFSGSMTTVPMDGFHLSDRQLAEQGLSHIKGAPQTFDRNGLAATLHRLGSSEPVYFPDFSHERHEPIAASIRVDPDTTLVVVEGNYLLLDQVGWRDLSALYDISVFLHTPWPTCRARLIPRHEWAGKEPDAAREWVDRSDRANYELVMSAHLPADLVVAE